MNGVARGGDGGRELALMNVIARGGASGWDQHSGS
jgi:hypothetical protein